MSPAELLAIHGRVASTGDRYSAHNLQGAIADVDHALFGAGFDSPTIKCADDLSHPVIFACRPVEPRCSLEETTARLEEAWLEHGGFAEEAHAIEVDEGSLVLDFVTWWHHGAFFTGRITVALERHS